MLSITVLKTMKETMSIFHKTIEPEGLKHFKNHEKEFAKVAAKLGTPLPEKRRSVYQLGAQFDGAVASNISKSFLSTVFDGVSFYSHK